MNYFDRIKDRLSSEISNKINKYCIKESGNDSERDGTDRLVQLLEIDKDIHEELLKKETDPQRIYEAEKRINAINFSLVSMKSGYKTETIN